MRSDQARTRSHREVIRRRRKVAAAGLLLCCTLVAITGSRLASAFTSGTGPAAASGPEAAGDSGSVAVEGTGPVATHGPLATGGPIVVAGSGSPAATATVSPVGSKSKAATSSSPRSSASTRPMPRATGVFARAHGGTSVHGSGTRKTYRVEVETGSRQSVQGFASAVDHTLANRASWTGQGRWSLQRVAGDADFVIRLATPATVDKVCATAGLNTRGYVSCRSGRYVMINLNRWLHAVPDYHGDVARYRQYVVNHEVGHQLGYVHQLCPRPGRLAPVMQQQTFGLHGCVANGWPYVKGKLI